MSEVQVTDGRVPYINAKNTARFLIFSFLGVFFFFVPVTINGTNSILIDHAVKLVSGWIGPQALPYVVLAIVAFGAFRPFVTGSWKVSRTTVGFAIVGLVGLFFSSMVVFDYGPNWIMNEEVAPFLYDAVASSVAILVPLGAIVLALLTGYGLMEFIGVFAQKIMGPVWKTPGRSAMDAVASFVGSYSVSMLITDKMYRTGRYTTREASIIAVGFSTMSVTFMVVIANALDLMDYWLVYFFVSLIVTFAVTAIVVRIPPLSRMPDTTYDNVEYVPEVDATGSRLRIAWHDAHRTADAAPNIFKNLIQNFWTGLKMAGNIVPSIMAIGVVALSVAHFTPVFDWLGYIFVPLMWVLGITDPVLAGKAAFLSITEVFLPATVVAGHEDLTLRLLIAVVSVSAIIFFSALIPTVKATKIPISIWEMVIIWFERVVLTIVIAAPICHLVVMLL